MDLELILLGLLVAAAVWPVAIRLPAFKRSLAFSALAAIAILGSIAGKAWFESTRLARAPVTNRPVEVNRDGYVSSSACEACHADNYHSWHASYHRTMTQVAGPDTVIGTFHGTELSFDGAVYRMERVGNEFWVEMPDPEWTGAGPQRPRVRKQIVLTTGSHHMQVYWYPTEQKRKLGQFPLIYLKEERRWIPRQSAFLHPPNAPFQQETARWNITCNRCHATHGRGRINGPNDIETDVVEFGIACEACHGPGGAHVEKNRNPRTRYRAHFEKEGDSSIVNPKRLAPELSSQVCGQCHGIFEFYSVEDALQWSEQGYPFRPGQELSQTRIMVKHDPSPSEPMMRHFLAIEPDYLEGRFWPDGMVRISGREYNAMMESPCAARGPLSCLSCHAMHTSADQPEELDAWRNDQLKAGMESNQACLQCHKELENRIEDHTRHAASSSGSLCYNCHMPHTTYGLMKAIRSHQIDSPSVARSKAAGRPIACNLCHLDQTLSWTARHLASWYGQPEPALSQEDQSIAASLLWLLKGDAGQRALAVWSMGWEPARDVSGTGWMPPFLARLLADPYDTVRFIAERSLRRIEGFDSFQYDFVGSPSSRASGAQKALKLWKQGEESGGGFSRALLFDEKGRLDEAEVERLLRQRDERPMNLKE